MTIDQDIQRISERVERMSNEYFEMRDMLLLDDVLDDGDQVILGDMARDLEAARIHVDNLIRESEGRPLIGSEDEQIENGATTGDDRVPFSVTKFKQAFEGSIDRWSLRASNSLGPVVNTVFAENAEATAIIGASDILAITAFAFPTSAVIPAVSACLPILDSCITAAFSSGGSNELAISILQRQWVAALSSFGQGDFSEAYLRFVDHWKRENNLTEDTLPADRAEEFEEACGDFGKEQREGGHMPNITEIEKAFVGAMIAQTEDSLDMDNQSGEVENEAR